MDHIQLRLFDDDDNELYEASSVTEMLGIIRARWSGKVFYMRLYKAALSDLEQRVHILDHALKVGSGIYDHAARRAIIAKKFALSNYQVEHIRAEVFEVVTHLCVQMEARYYREYLDSRLCERSLHNDAHDKMMRSLNNYVDGLFQEHLTAHI